MLNSQIELRKAPVRAGHISQSGFFSFRKPESWLAFCCGKIESQTESGLTNPAKSLEQMADPLCDSADDRPEEWTAPEAERQ